MLGGLTLSVKGYDCEIEYDIEELKDSFGEIRSITVLDKPDELTEQEVIDEADYAIFSYLETFTPEDYYCD